MKRIYTFLVALAFTVTAAAQTTPPSKDRGNASFTQIDQYLSVIKTIGIPTANSDNIVGQTSGPNSVKLVFNTTLNKLRVYDPITDTFRDAVETDLTNYYTKAEVDALLASIPTEVPTLQQVTDKGNVTNSGINITGGNGIDYDNTSGLVLSSINPNISANIYLKSKQFDKLGTWMEMTLSHYLLKQGNSTFKLNGFEDSGTPGATLNTRLSGNPAVNDNDFVAYKQMRDYVAENGGGTTPNLQSVTTGVGNNSTSNSILVKGASGLDYTKDGLHIWSDEENSTIIKVYNGEFKGGMLDFNANDGGVATLEANGSWLALRGQTNQYAGAQVSTRFAGKPAVNYDEFTTKAQLDAALGKSKKLDITMGEYTVGTSLVRQVSSNLDTLDFQIGKTYKFTLTANIELTNASSENQFQFTYALKRPSESFGQSAQASVLNGENLTGITGSVTSKFTRDFVIYFKAISTSEFVISHELHVVTNVNQTASIVQRLLNVAPPTITPNAAQKITPFFMVIGNTLSGSGGHKIKATLLRNKIEEI